METDQTYIMDAIKLFVKQNKIKKQSKLGILLSLIGISCGCLFYYFQQLTKQQITKKIQQITIQSPLNKSLLKSLNQSWQKQDFSSYTYLVPQFTNLKQIGKFDNIFVLLKNQQEQKIGLNCFETYSNVILQEAVLKSSFDPEEYNFATFLPKSINLKIDDIPISFVNSQQKVDSSFQDTNKYLTRLKYDSITHSSYQGDKQKQITKAFLLNKFLNLLFFSQTYYLTGPKISKIEPTSLLMENICIHCTALVHNDEIRLTNVTGIGNNFSLLKQTLIKHYNFQINLITNQQKITLAVIGLGIAYISYKIYQLISDKLKYYVIKYELPGIDKVKSDFNEVSRCSYYENNVYLCITCHQNKADFVFLPCYHLQSCRECFEKNQKLQCITCNKMVYCGIIIYNSK